MPSSTLLFHIGRDPEVGAARRTVARALSFYARAPVRMLLGLDTDIAWDEVVIWPLRRLLLLSVAKRARFWREARPPEPPHSGWWGSAAALAIWVGIMVAVLHLFPAVPAT